MLHKRLHTIFFAASVAFFSWLSFFIGETIDKYTGQSNIFLGGIWAMISTVVVFQAIYDDTLSAGSSRILGSFLGAVVSVINCSIFGYSIIGMISSIFLSILIIKLIKKPDTIRITAATSGIICAFGLYMPQNPVWENGLLRFGTAAIGALLAIIGSYGLEKLFGSQK